MNKTKIEWCDVSWNPGTGCHHDCPYCFARSMARRFKGGDFEPKFHPERLDEPLKEKQSKVIFLGSNCDLWGCWVPREWIERVLAVVEKARHHVFVTLTKNPARYQEFDLPMNLWPGASLDYSGPGEKSKAPSNLDRIHTMAVLQNERKILSIEPLFPGAEDFYIQHVPRVKAAGIIVGLQTPVHAKNVPSAVGMMALMNALKDMRPAPYRNTRWFYKDSIVKTYTMDQKRSFNLWFTRDLPWKHRCAECAHFHSNLDEHEDYDDAFDHEYYSCKLGVFESVPSVEFMDNPTRCEHFEEHFHGIEVCPCCQSSNLGMITSYEGCEVYCHDCDVKFDPFDVTRGKIPRRPTVKKNLDSFA